MHAAGDRAQYGCGPANSNAGGFCPQMTIAYSVRFNSDDHAAAYLDTMNNYVDYWRSLYPTGVAVGTNNFCPDGGCLGLFLNRYDLYSVFKPDLGGSWVEYNGASMAPTMSPAPTWAGGCSEPHNQHLDKCFQRKSRPNHRTAVAWDSLGQVGQASVFLITFMATTLAFSLFVSRARKKRRKGESYLGFFLRDTFKLKKKKRKKKSRSKKKRTLYRKLKGLDAERSMLDDKSRRSRASRSRSRSGRSKSKSSRSKSRSGKSRSKSRSNRLEAQTVASSGTSRRSSKSRSKSASRRSGHIV